MSNSAEQFIEKKVKNVFEPMITKCLIDKPDEPIIYMIEYLEKLQGTYCKSGEKQELEQLRKEMKKYKKLNHAVEEEIISDDEDEMNDYDLEEQRKFEESIRMKVSQISKQGCRASVSAEAYGNYNKKDKFTVKVIKKTAEQKGLIEEKILKSFLFNSLDDKELKNVIDAMGERKVKKGETIIKQGDLGDDLYIVESGELDCFKVFNETGEQFLKTYVKGEVFGELALLYNSPRAATIRSKTDCTLWTLDRETFNNIVKEATIMKRELYEKFLKSVDIFSTMDQFEISQICDTLILKKFKKGDVIIKQEENGDNFYIVEDGILEATKLFPGKNNQEVVMKYEKGRYFGELALIKNEPRAATITAKTDCRLLTLDRMAFKRLLGPIENLLKRNSSQYVKYIH